MSTEKILNKVAENIKNHVDAETKATSTEKALSEQNKAILKLSNDIYEYVKGDETYKAKFPDLLKMEKFFREMVKAVDSDFPITKDILFGQLLYTELCGLLYNPWELIKLPELMEDKIFQKLAKFLIVSKCNEDIFGELNSHIVYAKDIGEFNQDDANKYAQYNVSPLFDMIGSIKDIIEPVVDDKEAKTEIWRLFGISIDQVSTDTDEILKLLDEKDFVKSKEKTEAFINGFKESCAAWLDAVQKNAADILDEADAEKYAVSRKAKSSDTATQQKITKQKGSEQKDTSKPNGTKIDTLGSVKEILAVHNYTAIGENPGPHGMTYIIGTNTAGVGRYFLPDLTGIYCNKIPKIFITTNNGAPLFAVHVKDFQKWLEEVDNGVAKTTVNYVVSEKYLGLLGYGIDLASEVVLQNSKKLYSLIKSDNWNQFAAVYPPATIKLVIDQVDDILVIRTEAGEALFNIQEDKEGKCAVFNDTGFANVIARATTPSDPFVQYGTAVH